MMTNHLIAQKLLAFARTLQGPANLYRVRSYRHAAMVIDGMPRPVADILNCHGRRALANLPGIGDHLAFTIETLLSTGQVAPYPKRRSLSRVA